MIPATQARGIAEFKAFAMEVDQMVSEVRDLFGEGLVLHHAQLLYQIVARVIREEEEEARLDMEDSGRQFVEDTSAFYAENPCWRMAGGEREEYVAAHEGRRISEAVAVNQRRY